MRDFTSHRLCAYINDENDQNWCASICGRFLFPDLELRNDLWCVFGLWLKRSGFFHVNSGITKNGNFTK